MITFWIVFTLAGIAAWAWFVWACEGDGILMGLFIGAIAGLFAGGVAAASLGSRYPQHMVPTGTVELLSLRNSDAVIGTFFLGTGTVESVPYYFYFRPTDDGGYRQERIRAGEAVTVYEEDRSGGVLDVYERKFTDPANARWGADGGRTEYKFRIPRGSLKRQFRLE